MSDQYIDQVVARLEAARVFVGTISFSSIAANSAGKTRMNYVKIG
jgi:hypothetical protein